jgi:hypothetical protein
MPLARLETTQWGPFLNYLSKSLEGSWVEIEAASLALGAQVQNRWLPLLGLAYDPKDDLIELALEGLDHLIHRPRDVFVDQGSEALVASVEIIDADGLRQIVKFKEPLMLPPPQA